MPKIILIHGPRCVGKDTLYSLFQKILPLTHRFAYADALKDDLYELIQKKMGISVYTCSPAEKEIIRPILIAYGCAQRQLNENYWANIVAEDIAEFFSRYDNGIACVTDNRFPNELDVMVSAFGRENVVMIDVRRHGAPEPTSEEMKHVEKMRELADIRLVWGGESEEEKLYVARNVLKQAGIETQF